MIRINYWDIANVLFDIQNVHGAERTALERLDQNNKAEVMEAFQRYLLPIHEARASSVKERIRETVRYFLTTRNAPLEGILDNLQDSPIGIPDDPYSLVAWLWEVFYPNEDYAVTNVEEYKEENVDRPLGPT